GVRHREHGGPQARRVRADAPLPRSHRPEGGRQEDDGDAGGTGAGRARREVMSTKSRERAERRRAERQAVGPQSTQRSARQSPYKMRLVIDEIRGKMVNDAL